jgi:hypothetical protein
LPSTGILLDEIRAEEVAYNKRIADAKSGKAPSQPQTPAVARNDEKPAKPERDLDPPVRRDNGGNSLEKQQGKEVAAARPIDYDAIRRRRQYSISRAASQRKTSPIPTAHVAAGTCHHK